LRKNKKRDLLSLTWKKEKRKGLRGFEKFSLSIDEREKNL